MVACQWTLVGWVKMACLGSGGAEEAGGSLEPMTEVSRPTQRLTGPRMGVFEAPPPNHGAAPAAEFPFSSPFCPRGPQACRAMAQFGAACVAIRGSLRLEQSRWRGAVAGLGEGCWVQASPSTPKLSS